jgi:hypothetical protein
VNSDAEKVAASSSAAAVDGVKQVLNNLDVQPGANLQATTQPPSQPQPARPANAAPASAPMQSPPRKNSALVPRKVSSAEPTEEAYNPPPSKSETPAPAPVPPPAVAAAPASHPAPAPAQATLPDGTLIWVRLIDTLDSEVNRSGDVFRATLSAPITIDENVVVPEGADIQGRVVDVQSAGKFAGRSVLTIELTDLSYNGQNYPLTTSQWTRKGSSRGKGTAEKVGIGAALGAIIGGVAGGGKGAAIGTAAGAGVGGGVQAASKAQAIKLRSETVISFNLQGTLTVMAARDLKNNSNRQPMN